MRYKSQFTQECLRDIKKLKKSSDLLKRLKNKINEILCDPYRFKPLRYSLKNKRRIHIGSFVLIFKIDEEEKIIEFISFRHHDDVYNEAD
ncbi:MAG: type II toxin-antitoxin system RelE/ParE family toxin [Candidatus Omnitrophota bacterium]